MPRACALHFMRRTGNPIRRATTMAAPAIYLFPVSICSHQRHTDDDIIAPMDRMKVSHNVRAGIPAEKLKRTEAGLELRIAVMCLAM